MASSASVVWRQAASTGHPDQSPSARRAAIAGLPCFIVMDSERRILQASPFAFYLLEDCPSLALVCGTLRAAETDDGSKLSAAFHSVLTGTEVQAQVRLESCGLLTEVQLVPLVGGDRVGVIAIVSQPEARVDDHVERAIGTFGLTASEARVLRLLCAGYSLSRVSALLDIGRNTVRTHVQRIFQKTGTHRQAELIRRVLAP